MAVTTKVTYSLKPETVSRVQELALKWGVPKSEVIRRVVSQAAHSEPDNLTPLQALARLQKEGIGVRAATKFNNEVRRERLAWRKTKE